MRDELIGYLFEALDDADMRRVEAALAQPDQGATLRRELETLRRAIKPLDRARETFVAPPGLAGRTLRFISQQAPVAPAAGRRADVGPLPTPSPFCYFLLFRGGAAFSFQMLLGRLRRSPP